MPTVPRTPACLAKAMPILASLLVTIALLGVPSSEPLAAPMPAPTAPPPPEPPAWRAAAPQPNPANLLHNSSLEHCTSPDMPDWWRPGEAWSDFRAANAGVEYGVVPGAGCFHDKAVVLRNTRESNRSALDCPYMKVPDKTRPCVFTVYLRADRPDFAARIGVYGGFDRSADSPELAVDANSCLKPVRVGTEWRRFTVVSPAFRQGSTISNRVAVIADQVGELYIDGLQLECGPTPTAYGPRPDDEPFRFLPSAADLVARRTLQEMTVDGAFSEPVWSEVTQTDSFARLGGREPVGARTWARVVFGEEALYVGFTCEESLDVHVAANSLFESDHVAVYVSGQPDGWGFRHFALDTSGRTYAAVGRAPRFESGVQGAVRTGQGVWTAEMRIPWSEIGLPLAAPDAVRLNLGRFRHSSGEWSSYSAADATLHEPRVFVKVLALDPRTLEDHGAEFLTPEITREGDGVYVSGGVRLPAQVAASASGEVKLGETRLPARLAPGGEDGLLRYRAGPFKADAHTREPLLVWLKRADGGMLALRTWADVRIPPRYEVFFERSYYTSERTARLVVVSHSAEPTEYTVTSEKGGYRERRASDPSGITYFEISVADAPENVVRFGVSAGGLRVGDAKLTVREPRPNEVKIDYLHRCLVVEGKPFVPVAPGWLVRENLRDLAPGDWNCVMLKRWHEPTGVIYASGEVTEEAVAEWRAFMDASWRQGLRVIFHLPMKLDDNSCTADEEASRTLVEAFRDHPALLAWHTVDEPGSRATPEKLLRAANLVRELDPHHPVWINEATFWQKALEYCETAQPACDVFSVDHYPIGAAGDGVRSIATWSERLNDLGRGRKPMLMWLQAFGAIEWWSREPTPGEERAMTYLAFCHDMRGVLYFVYRPRSAALWSECQTLGSELCSVVNPVLADTVRTRPVDLGLDAVHATLLETESLGPHLMAVNIGREPLRVRLRPADLGVASAPDPTGLLPEGLEAVVVGDAVAFTLEAQGSALVRLGE